MELSRRISLHYFHRNSAAISIMFLQLFARIRLDHNSVLIAKRLYTVNHGLHDVFL